MAPAVLLNRLSFGYDEEIILNEASFRIEKGEFVCIIGPNGGGKTTLLKLLMGLIKPSSGLIELFGLSPKAARTRIGYVPQILRCDRQFPISVMELVLEGRLSRAPWWGSFREDDKIAALKALEKVGLVEFKDRSFGTLSGGQAQRALIARALASEPELLLLDEPTASVDSKAETDIYSLLKELTGSITIIMVTHHLKTVVDFAPRILCVQKEIFSLKPEQICEHFAIGLYHPIPFNMGPPKQ